MASSGNDDEKSLFFAYARRTDHNTFSRYMLTFADRETAEEWWNLVRKEYPDTVRSNPQLFSFTGDGRPGQIWDNRNFAHLKTKWLYTQFGDAKDTHGAAQATIPVQAGSFDGRAASSASPSGSLDMDKLAAVLEKSNKQISDQVQAAIKPLPEQVQQLTAAHKSSAGNLDRLQKIVEQQHAQFAAISKGSAGSAGQKPSPSDTDRLQKIIEEQNKQMEAARKSSSAETDRLQKMIEEQSKQNEALTSKLGDVASILEKSSQSKPTTKENASQNTLSVDLDRLQSIIEQQDKQIEALTSKLRDVASMLERFTESNPATQGSSSRSTSSANLDGLQNVIEQQNKQIETLTSRLGGVADALERSSQSKSANQNAPSPDSDRLQKMIEQQYKQIELLTSKLGDAVDVFERSGHPCGWGQSMPVRSTEHECDIKPPPRKLNRRVTGYTCT